MRKKFPFSLILCLIFYACAGSGRMVRTESPKPELDTLDVIFDARADSQITVHQPKSENIAMVDTAIPVISEPQQPSDPVDVLRPLAEGTRTGPGFRVQVMASSSQAAAVQYLDEAKQKLNQTGYVIPDGNLWKVQMGDFAKREDADAFKKIAQANGFSSAWIVATTIKSATESPLKQPPAPAEAPSSKMARPGTEKYRIQIFAGISKTSAETLAEKAKDLAGDEIFVLLEQGLWKVRVGDFETRESAERALTNWKNQGYQNAWIVEIR